MEVEVEYFKCVKQTKRFKLNQKVWVRDNYANHLKVYFKHRGYGRYVNGTVDKLAKCVGEIKKINVDELFASRIKTS